MRRCVECQHLFQGLRSPLCGLCRQEARNARKRAKRRQARAGRESSWIEARLQQLEAEARQKRWTA